MHIQSRSKVHSACIVVLFVSLVSIFSCSDQDSLVTKDGIVDWNRYYSTEETYRIMREFSILYPHLARMYSIGKSLNNVDLYVMEVTNRENREPENKPAVYIDGNIHSGELTGSAVTLYLMNYLLTKYGNDPAVTNLLDTRTFYLRPKFNPDGADLALLQNIPLRSTTRPFDSDGDGQADEDPPDDLDGDGYFTRMRIPDSGGEWKTDPEDPRLMIRRESGETDGDYYRVVGEGIDNDGDGRLNEDGVGGLDLNRNFPRNWELQYLQSGAGPFPLSEPETYAALKFLNTHRNVGYIIHNHTSGGFLYRLPSTADPSTFPLDDLELINTLSNKYTELTGRPVHRSYTSPERHRYGTLISWGYWDMGVIGWVPEYWPGIQHDYDGDGETSERERLRYNDEELGGKYFSDWTSYDHPEYGSVEIGGWHRIYITQNPPPELLEEECKTQIPWILYIAEQTPLIEAAKPVITPLDNETYKIEITVSNSGGASTNLTERALQAHLIKPVEAEIDVFGANIMEGEKKQIVGHLGGSKPVIDRMRQSVKTVSWIVRKDASNARISIKITSEKGGSIFTGNIPLGK